MPRDINKDGSGVGRIQLHAVASAVLIATGRAATPGWGADQVAIALRPGSNAGDVHVGVFVLNPRFSFSLGYKHAYIFATKLELDDTIQHSESLQVGRFNIGWSFRFSDRVTPYQHLLHRRDSRRAGPGSPVLGPGSLLTEGDGSQRSAPPGSPSGRPSGLVKPLISWAGRKPVRSCAMPARLPGGDARQHEPHVSIQLAAWVAAGEGHDVDQLAGRDLLDDGAAPVVHGSRATGGRGQGGWVPPRLAVLPLVTQAGQLGGAISSVFATSHEQSF